MFSCEHKSQLWRSFWREWKEEINNEWKLNERSVWNRFISQWNWPSRTFRHSGHSKHSNWTEVEKISSRGDARGMFNYYVFSWAGLNRSLAFWNQTHERPLKDFLVDFPSILCPAFCVVSHFNHVKCVSILKKVYCYEKRNQLHSSELFSFLILRLTCHCWNPSSRRKLFRFCFQICSLLFIAGRTNKIWATQASWNLIERSKTFFDIFVEIQLKSFVLLH